MSVGFKYADPVDSMTKAIIFLSLCVSPTFVFSAEFQWASDYYAIDELYPLDDGMIFQLSNGADVGSSCPGRFNIADVDDNYKTKIATLMVSFVTEKAVKLNYDASYTGCTTPVSRFKVSK